ncbi:hypothetical protein JOE66_001343 [Subtercola frigoramans]|uniref:Uncharacterized protein n=1 Tax=Subtercola frigoramans TaxID=120298 RepID=A0ABS2L3X0_9MICO|nr:hypothetical protein [Subtercola frigoramans]
MGGSFLSLCEFALTPNRNDADSHCELLLVGFVPGGGSGYLPVTIAMIATTSAMIEVPELIQVSR